MKVILYILLSIVALFVLFFLGVMLVTFYRLATGKISKEEQERIVSEYRRDKEHKRQQKALHDMIENTNQSALDIIMGRPAQPKKITIDIKLEKKESHKSDNTSD